MKPDFKRNTQAGYTLLELLVVLAVIALIAGLVTTQVFQYLGRAKTEAAEIQLQKLSADLDFFKLDLGRYPTEAEGLKALLEAPSGADKWRGPYTTGAEALTDPWGYEFHYTVSGSGFELKSLGADNAEGGDGEDGDVSSKRQ